MKPFDTLLSLHVTRLPTLDHSSFVSRIPPVSRPSYNSRHLSDLLGLLLHPPRLVLLDALCDLCLKLGVVYMPRNRDEPAERDGDDPVCMLTVESEEEEFQVRKEGSQYDGYPKRNRFLISV